MRTICPREVGVEPRGEPFRGSLSRSREMIRGVGKFAGAQARKRVYPNSTRASMRS